MKPRSTTTLVIIYLILFLALAMWWFPLLWIFLTSIRPLADTLAFPPVWVFTPTLEHYSLVLNDSYFIQALVNSIITASSSTLCILVISIPAAYILARYDFKNIEFYIISTKMTPPIVVLFASYIMFFKLGILGSRFALIILHIAFNLPLGVWLLKGFFQNIPVEIDEAAKIDGCSQWQIIMEITIPLTLPGIATTGVLCFMFSWMEFLFASTITGRNTLTCR